MPDELYQRVDGVLETAVDEEVILLSQEMGFYALNDSATVAWDVLAEPATIADVASAFLEQFEVDEATALAAAAEIVAAMVQRKTVAVV